MNEFTTIYSYVLPWRVIPTANSVKPRVKARFGVRLNVAFKDITQHSSQILIRLGLRVKLQPRLRIRTTSSWIILAKLKYMPGPIWNGRHQGVAERRLRRIAAAC